MPILRLNNQELGELPRQSLKLTFNDGKSGNVQTIKFMARVARQRSGHPLIRSTALKILNSYGVQSQNHLDEALAIGDWVKNNIIYRRDPDNVEYLQDPVIILEDAIKGQASGDCDDMATLIATLLISIGARPFFRAVRYDSSFGNFNHIYVVVYDRNWGEAENRAVLDAILKRDAIGAEVPHINGEEFEV